MKLTVFKLTVFVTVDTVNSKDKVYNNNECENTVSVLHTLYNGPCHFGHYDKVGLEQTNKNRIIFF